MNLLSFGGGVNSTALLVLAIQGKIKIDAVIFANTKCELPETYEHLEYIKEICKQNNLPFYEISEGDLFDFYYNTTTFPYRISRSCTDRYKIQPMHKFAKKQFNEEIVWIMGFDYGEQNRAKKYQFYKSKYEFPLIDYELDREGCKQIIKDFGLLVPVKSGCYFCPFTKKQGWIDLYMKHPELFEKAIKLEKNGRSYPQYTITNKPLEDVKKAIQHSIKYKKEHPSLCNWVNQKGESCIYCHQ